VGCLKLDILEQNFGCNAFQMYIDKNCLTPKNTLKTAYSPLEFATHYAYDIHGNVKSLLHDNPVLAATSSSLASQRFKRMDYTYDLISGNVKQVSYQNEQPDAWHHYYEYDADNRIKTVHTSTYPYASKSEFSPSSYSGAAFWDEDVVYHYYDHGPLARTELGEHTVQGVDFAYSLQGWLVATNSNTLLASRDMGKDGATGANKNFALDAFGFSLGYFNGDYEAISQPSTVNNPLADKTGSNLLASTSNLFNGNISSMVTTITPPTITPGGLTYAPSPQGMAYKYDRLNRLKQAKAWQNINTVDNVWESGLAYAGLYENNFSYDANGNITAQVRKDATGTAINDLTYNRRNVGGKTVQNRLYHVNDAVLNTTFTDDIDDQGTFINNETVNTANNYGYDEIGNLNRNSQKEIEEMVYTVTGKVKEVRRTVGSNKENLKFDFDANGNRIAKHVYTSDDIWKHTDYYVNDAQGNNMAIYTLTASSGSGLSYQLAERNIFGSSRVGTNKTPVEMIGATLPTNIYTHQLGDKNYFLSSHTNNTLVTVTDKKIPIDNNNDLVIDQYWPHVISSADYYGYGVKMKERSFSTESTRYQFNGKEYDSETETTNQGARNSDGDLGIMETIDALFKKYADQSPYNLIGNNAIWLTDEDGNEIKIVTQSKKFRETSFTAIQKLTDKQLVLLRDGSVREATGLPNSLIKDVILTGNVGVKSDKDFGTLIVGDLVNSQNLFEIQEREIGSSEFKSSNIAKASIDIQAGKETNIGSGGIIFLNTSTEGGVNEKGSRQRPVAVGLGHELIHAHNADNGELDPRPSDFIDVEGSKTTLSNDEISTRIKENIIRSEQGEINRKLPSSKGIESLKTTVLKNVKNKIFSRQVSIIIREVERAESQKMGKI